MWLMETGERLMKNLNEGRTIEASIRKTTFELGEADYLISATEERIMHLHADILNLNSTLSRAEHQLDRAENVLRRKTRTRDIARLGVSVLLPFAGSGSLHRS